MPGTAPEIPEEEIGREFENQELLVRKIADSDLHPKASGGRRVSQAAFSASSLQSDQDRGMSVDRLRILQLIFDDPSDRDQYASEMEVLMTLKVQDLWDLGLEIRHEPKPGNPAHCNVLGVKSSTRKRLLKAAGWLRQPKDVGI